MSLLSLPSLCRLLCVFFSFMPEFHPLLSLSMVLQLLLGVSTCNALAELNHRAVVVAADVSIALGIQKGLLSFVWNLRQNLK